MANVVKERGRKPLVENAASYTGNTVAWIASDMPGFVRATGYLYTVTAGGITMQFSEDEMLETASKWIEDFTNKRRREKIDAKRVK